MPETITIPSLGQVACAVCSVCRGKIYPASALRAHLAHHQSRGWRKCSQCAKTYHVLPGSKWDRCPACSSQRAKRAHSRAGHHNGGRPRGDNYKPRKPAGKGNGQ